MATLPTKPNLSKNRLPGASARLLRRKLLQGFTAIVWALVFAAGIGRFKLAAKPPLRVTLKTSPAQIHLSLDGVKQADGSYIGTPTTLDLSPGKHRLKIARDGYIAHSVSIEGESGDLIRMDEVVLEKAAASRFAPADIQVKTGSVELYTEIDDGFITGMTPLNTEDLVADSVHTLMIYPKWPDRSDAYRCRFKTPASDASEPVLVEVTAKNGKIKSVSNCQKLKMHAKPQSVEQGD